MARRALVMAVLSASRVNSFSALMARDKHLVPTHAEIIIGCYVKRLTTIVLSRCLPLFTCTSIMHSHFVFLYLSFAPSPAHPLSVHNATKTIYCFLSLCLYAVTLILLFSLIAKTWTQYFGCCLYYFFFYKTTFQLLRYLKNKL